LIAVIIAILAVIGTVTAIPLVTANAFWVSIVAFIVLSAGCLMKDL
jgi:hypothetical protein